MKRLRVGGFEILALVLVTFTFQLLGFHGWLASAEGKVVDSILKGKAGTSPGEVVVVEIDSQAYKDCFGACSPLKPAMVVKIAKELASATPAAVGVDILTESPAYRDLDAPEDVVWIGGFEDQKPLREIGYLEWLKGHTEEVKAVPVPVLGQDQPASVHWGMPTLLLDEDRKVRRIARRFWLTRSLDRYPTGSQTHFATAVADSYCAHKNCEIRPEGSDTYLQYAKAPARIPLQKIWSCQNGRTDLWPLFEYEVKEKKIVLLGGTYRAARDFYPTPVGELPGALILAYAIQSEIGGKVLPDVYRPLAIAGDMIIALLVVLLHNVLEDRHFRGWEFVFMVSTVALVVAAGVGITRFLGPQYLSGLVGAVAGILTERFLHPLRSILGVFLVAVGWKPA